MVQLVLCFFNGAGCSAAIRVELRATQEIHRAHTQPLCHCMFIATCFGEFEGSTLTFELKSQPCESVWCRCPVSASQFVNVLLQFADTGLQFGQGDLVGGPLRRRITSTPASPMLTLPMGDEADCALQFSVNGAAPQQPVRPVIDHAHSPGIQGFKYSQRDRRGPVDLRIVYVETCNCAIESCDCLVDDRFQFLGLVVMRVECHADLPY